MLHTPTTQTTVLVSPVAVHNCLKGKVWKTVKTPMANSRSGSEAIDRSEHNEVYVAQTGVSSEVTSEWSSIAVYDVNGNLIREFGKGRLGRVTGLSVTGNMVYVLSTCTQLGHKGEGEHNSFYTTVQKYTVRGVYKGFWHVEGAEWLPADVAARQDGKVAVSLIQPLKAVMVIIYNRDGTVCNVIAGEFGMIQHDIDSYRSAMQLYFDSDGRLHVTDTGSDAVKVFDESGLELPKYHANINKPGAIFIDRNDTSYVLDSDGYLHIFTPQQKSPSTKKLWLAQDIAVDSANCKVWTRRKGKDRNFDKSFVTIFE